MNNDRLRHLAGMKHPEGHGDNEVLQEMRAHTGPVTSVRDIAYQLFQLAEAKAYSESEAGHQPVTGHSINHEYERIKQQMDQYVEELIKGEHN